MNQNECIICLDDCESKYIQYPVNYSGCSCKYYIHNECNNKWGKKECIICHTPFNNEQIEIKNNQIENNNFHHELDENIGMINCTFCRLPYFICLIIILFILVCSIVILFIV
jgi:hypothetical protein